MKKNKKGFTLLEVLLAVAIMLIASTMILQGFISTLVYSANTALYAKSGAKNTEKMYDTVASKKGINKELGGAGVTTIKYTFDGSTTTYRVNTWSSKDLEAKLADGDSNTSFNRYAVTYALPNLKCPKCGKVDNVGISQVTGNWICTKCEKELVAPSAASDPE